MGCCKWAGQDSIKRVHAHQLPASSCEWTWKQAIRERVLGLQPGCHLPDKVHKGSPQVPSPVLLPGVSAPLDTLTAAQISKDSYRRRARESGENGGCDEK